MLCPKCHREISENQLVCPFCKEGLFPLTDEGYLSGASNHLIKINGQYMQYETSLMHKTKIASLIILFAYSLLIILSMFLPLLTYIGGLNPDFVNIFSYINFGSVNVLTLIRNLTDKLNFDTLQGNTYLINSHILKAYNILTLCLLTCIVVLACLILFFVIRDFIKKSYSGKYKFFIGLISVFSLILLLGFSFDGVGNLLILSSSVMVLIWYFVSGIISHEKKLKSKTNGIKVSLILLFGFILLSVCMESMYIKDGSQDLIPTSFVATEIVSGKPYTQIILQFIAINSFDGNVAMTLNIILGATFMVSLVMLCIASVAFISLLKSLSNQNVRLPLKRIWICVALMIVFISLNYLFCSLANDAYYAKALSEALKNGEILSSEESKALQEAESYFQIPLLCLIGCILSVPFAIYATIARKLMLKVKD